MRKRVICERMKPLKMWVGWKEVADRYWKRHMGFVYSDVWRCMVGVSAWVGLKM